MENNSVVPEKTNEIHRILAGFMGVAALFASGCDSPSLDAKPVPTATVTVTAGAAPKEGDMVRIRGTITCANNAKFAGASVRSVNGKPDTEAGWVPTAPTDDPSVVKIKKMRGTIGDILQFDVGCGGTFIKIGRAHV